MKSLNHKQRLMLDLHLSAKREVSRYWEKVFSLKPEWVEYFSVHDNQ